MIQRRAQRVDVSASVGVSLFSVVLLRRGVLRRTQPSHHRSRARVVGIYQLHQSEINQHCAPLRRDNYILRLDVAVDHALLVAIGEGIHQLLGPPKHLAFSQPPLLGDNFIQPLALNQIHHQIGVAILLEVIGDAGQVGAAEICQHLCFLLELLTKLRQCGPRSARIGYHLLERTADAKSAIHRLVDSTHATLAQQGDDPVATVNYLSWDKGHYNSCIRICLQGDSVLSARGGSG